MKPGFSKKDLKDKLNKDQFSVLVDKGTEPPFTGKLLYNNEKGDYTCPVCGTLLFHSDTKYDSNTPGLAGWPSFSDVIKENVEFSEDNELWMKRTEVTCKTCGSHLGHLFDDPTSPTGQHYCINSAALNFKPIKEK